MPFQPIRSSTVLERKAYRQLAQGTCAEMGGRIVDARGPYWTPTGPDLLCHLPHETLVRCRDQWVTRDRWSNVTCQEDIYRPGTMTPGAIGATFTEPCTRPVLGTFTAIVTGLFTGAFGFLGALDLIANITDEGRLLGRRWTAKRPMPTVLGLACLGAGGTVAYYAGRFAYGVAGGCKEAT